MLEVNSRVTEVIETTQGDDVTYFTLAGLLIGGFKGGERIVIDPPPQKEKPRGAVVKPLTPQQIRRAKDKEADSLNTPEGKLAHLKRDVA